MHLNSALSVNTRAILLAVTALCISLIALFSWQHRGWYAVTGDEGYFLMAANGIIENASFEQAEPLARESTDPIFHAAPLPVFNPSEAELSHAVVGPRGVFSIHGMGLPLLLALPVLIGGVMGAKIFLVVLTNVLLVLVLWKLARHYQIPQPTATLAVAALTLAWPVLPMANQIYPDLLGGIISLLGLYLVLTAATPRTITSLFSYSACIAFLPWLHVRFSPIAFILGLVVLSQIWRTYSESQRTRSAIALMAPLTISALCLLAFFQYAYGQLTGPYVDHETVNFEIKGLLVFLGLLFDQNQGMLINNPLLWVGFLAFPTLIKKDGWKGWLTLLFFLLLIVPPAMHFNWYGGNSYNGRFGAAAAVVLMLPTILGLSRIANGWPALAKTLLIGAIVWQAYLLYLLLAPLGDAAFLSRSQFSPPLPLSNYSLFFSSIAHALPAFYGDDASWNWVYEHTPNLMFLAGLVAFGVFGCLLIRASDLSFSRFVFGGFLSFLLITAVLAQSEDVTCYDRPTSHVSAWPASALQSKTGITKDEARHAEGGVHPPGHILFGPYVYVAPGNQALRLRYNSDVAPDVSVAILKIRTSPDLTSLTEVIIHGSGGEWQVLTIPFESGSPLRRHEFAIDWWGKSNLTISNLELLAASCRLPSGKKSS